MAWLSLCCDPATLPPTRDAHVHPPIKFNPDYNTRNNARDELMLLEDADRLAMQEWEGVDVVPREPPLFT